MRKIIKKILFLIAGLLGLGIIIIIISNTVVVVDKYNVIAGNVPSAFDGFKVVQLSDLHSKEFGRENGTLLKKIAKINPDIIVMTGDMVNSTDTEFSIFLTFAKKLAENYPVYYIVGNHEQALSKQNLAFIYNELKSYGVNVLDNEMAVIEKDDAKINIYGMWFNLRYYSDQTSAYVLDNPDIYYFAEDTMRKILGECGRESFNILLTHNPVFFDTYSKWGADLTLSGHIHGGMVRIPFIGGIYSPEKTFFPKYDEGLFEENDKRMIVSRGIGNGSLGFRFLNCPQIVEITLYSSK
ncbi:phosphohydrolase [Anaerocolumna cellulosilytica]|uniref:Phosphohydrolase n=1 Tax=Anaerocolumna cellulosilytica TaxID=433286 RepID=A0A6S6QYS6_9FIRM|nr:metallophosphoesterase [Anaerocolumna cellulosilytica]MBB5194817.1 hypothetical protein [Anaerocolumna cellulosilytica]BCJ94219.1 phosphohydrolase [Anaerocolumna cellulosilytica]